MLTLNADPPKRFDYMKRAIMQGRFIDAKTGCSVDAQTKLISKVMRQPEEFRKYGGINRDYFPELFISDHVLKHKRDQKLYNKHIENRVNTISIIIKVKLKLYSYYL